MRPPSYFEQQPGNGDVEPDPRGERRRRIAKQAGAAEDDQPRQPSRPHDERYGDGPRRAAGMPEQRAPGEPEQTVYERSDFCALPRAVPIGEAMMALVLADALMEKLGGDSIDEMRPRFEKLRRAHVDDLPMDNAEWRFGYD